jgi:iduronate 2-sulfatase
MTQPHRMDRRGFLKRLAATAAGGAVAATGWAAASPQPKRPNVLMICVDDLRPELGCYGVKGIHTPNIDRLASRGRLFLRHYVQSAVCVPSRYSLLTGMRTPPNWAKVRKLKTEPTRPVSFAHVFRRGGYRTVCLGKISHLPGGVIDPKQETHEVPFSWDLAYAPVGKWKDPWGAFFCYADGSVREYGYGRNKINTPAYEMADVPDEGYADGLNAQEAVKQLRDLKARRQPFFLAVGFYKPHLPHNAPKKYWDLYDPAKVGQAANRTPPKNVDPAISLHPSFEVTTHYAWPGGEGKITDAQATNQRRAYFACVSYVDAQVGKVLAELKKLDLERDTIVLLWGDHGWHLGEHGIFGKQTNFEIATRSPLIVSVPEMAAPGKPAGGLVETVDIYPTLTDLCGLTAPADLAGTSLTPLLENPDHPGKDGAYSFFGRKSHFGKTLRTDRYRIVEWTDRKTGKVAQTELYDHQADPRETRNIAAQYPDVVRKLLPRLRGGKTQMLPGRNGNG